MRSNHDVTFYSKIFSKTAKRGFYATTNIEKTKSMVEYEHFNVP